MCICGMQLDRRNQLAMTAASAAAVSDSKALADGEALAAESSAEIFAVLRATISVDLHSHAAGMIFGESVSDKLAIGMRAGNLSAGNLSAYLAGVTEKLGLATGVIILPQRQTALFAKQAADVDLFSNGRLRLCVGVGWNWVEYDALEMPGHFRRRGKRQELQIELIRKLWAQPVVDHQDSDHRIDRAGILPRPKRQIPIWLGGFSEIAYDRAARIADGFLFSGRSQTEAVRIKARIEARLAELGRGGDAFGFESIQQYSRGGNQWPGDIAAWRDAGGSHISVVTMGANLTTVDSHVDAIRRWREVYNAIA